MRALFAYLFIFFKVYLFFAVDHFLKSLLNLLQYRFCFMFWFLGHKAYGFLAPRLRIEPAPPALEGEVLTTGLPGESLYLPLSFVEVDVAAWNPCFAVLFLHLWHLAAFCQMVITEQALVQWWRICLQCSRRRFDPWVGKITWRRKWQPTSIFLPGKLHEQRSLEAYRARGRKSVGHNSATKQQPESRTQAPFLHSEQQRLSL